MAADRPVTLTARQREIVERFVAGAEVRDIAAELHCSEWTIRAHLYAVAVQLPGPHPPLRRIAVHGRDLLGAPD